MMLGLTLAAVMTIGMAQDGQTTPGGDARMEACAAYETLWARRFPEGETPPPEHYAARDASHEQCIALGGSGRAWFHLYLRSGSGFEPPSAPEALEAALAFEPDNPTYLLYRGRDEWWRNGGGQADIARALEIAAERGVAVGASVRDPKLAEALVAGDLHQSLVALGDQRLSWGARYADDYRIRAMAYLTLGQPDRALDDLDAAVEAHTGWGEDFFGNGDVIGSRIRLERALVLTRLGRGSEAISEINESLRLSRSAMGDAPEHLLTLCRAQVEAGDARAALSACEQVGEMGPGEVLAPARAAYLGLVQERLGREDRARRLYRQAVEAGDARPDSQVAAYLRQDGLETARAGLARLERRPTTAPARPACGAAGCS